VIIESDQGESPQIFQRMNRLRDLRINRNAARFCCLMTLAILVFQLHLCHAACHDRYTATQERWWQNNLSIAYDRFINRDQPGSNGDMRVIYKHL